jgi:hypothetical protein
MPRRSRRHSYTHRRRGRSRNSRNSRNSYRSGYRENNENYNYPNNNSEPPFFMNNNNNNQQFNNQQQPNINLQQNLSGNNHYNQNGYNEEHRISVYQNIMRYACERNLPQVLDVLIRDNIQIPQDIFQKGMNNEYSEEINRLIRRTEFPNSNSNYNYDPYANSNSNNGNVSVQSNNTNTVYF